MTRISNKWNESRLLRLFAAALLNAAVLGFILLIVNVGYESNDDLTLAAFVDGQMANPDAHIPYINYVFACMLKLVYDVLGRGVAWFAIGQYMFIFLSFSAVSFVLFERLRFWQGAVISIIMLLFFGVDAYTIISYTKTAGVCAVGGMMLLVHGMESLQGKWRIGTSAFGILLCAVGFMLRPMEFLPCFGIMAVLCLRWFYGLLFAEKGSLREKLISTARFAAPFVIVVGLCGGLYAADEAAWSKEPYSFYHDFDESRVACVDFGRPAYAEMQAGYESLGLSESAVALFLDSSYFDTELFTAENLDAISAMRAEFKSNPSIGECLGIFLDQCLLGFFRNLHVYGFLLILALWLCAGEHKLRDWLTVAGICGLFALMYFYLIYRGRYLVDRVDMPLFFALACCLSYMIKPEKLQREKTLAAALLLLALGTSYYLTRDVYRSNAQYFSPESRAAVERLMEDTEHLYLAKVDAVDDRVYSPLEPAAAGYWDRILYLGGWTMNHPAIMNTMAQYGVENPYRDAVDNNRVYIIDNDIELTLSHIRTYYAPDAAAELVEPLSSETGLSIYRIYS